MVRTVPASQVAPGDTGRLWRHYDDHVRVVRLAAQPAGDRVLARSAGIERLVRPPSSLDGAPAWSFFPPALAGDLPDVEVVEAVKTGGRTFRLTEASLATLGLPIDLHLDLPRLGWGTVRVGADLEIKGAGTDADQVRLEAIRLRRVLDEHPPLGRSWARAMADPTAVMASLATYLGRNRGGQSSTAGRSAVVSTDDMLVQSLVKVAPTWIAVTQSEAVHEHLRIVSVAADPGEALYHGSVVNELRLSPGSVRAVYFDTAAGDDDLRHWARRVSTDGDELAACSQEMVEDSRRYLELMATSTAPTSGGVACRWTKVGDVNLMFGPGPGRRYDDAEEYRYKRTGAWFLAKDEVVVGGAGKFFIDMESVSAGQHGYLSLLGREMRLHHELYVLTVLRDHVRVCTQFEIARLLAEGDEVGPGQRRALQRAVLRRIAEAVERSDLLALDVDAQRVVASVRYPGLDGMVLDHCLTRPSLAERY